MAAKHRIRAPRPYQSSKRCLDPANFPGETWKPIENYPGYEVSSESRVRCFLERRTIPGTSIRPNVIGDTSSIVPPKINTGGDLVVRMYNDHGTRCYVRIDRLHHAAFVEPHEAEPDERWLAIPEWPGYEVSDIGRVRSFWTAYGQTDGQWVLSDSPRLLWGYKNNRGYPMVGLTRRFENGQVERKYMLVHVLVLTAFVGPRPSPDFDACHADSDRANARLLNLRWDTKSANSIDMAKRGTTSGQILDSSNVVEIWYRLVDRESSSLIAKDYGVGLDCIDSIRQGNTWGHLTRKLPGWPLTVRPDSDQPPIFIDLRFCREDEEIWRPVVGFPAYEVSNWGRAASLWQAAMGGHRGKREIGTTRRILSLARISSGYLGFGVSKGTGKQTTLGVHREVLRAFAGEPPVGMIACHIDGDKTNNRASNLRWDSYSSNRHDQLRHGWKRRSAV